MTLDAKSKEIDFTQTYWGHNLQKISGEGDHGEFWVWCTPNPRKGDTIRWRTAYGEVVALIENSEYTMNVDDMFKIKVRIIERIQK